MSRDDAPAGSAYHPDYEVVIGLEVHTQLATRSKLFSPAPVEYGDAPNHDVHPIDLGLPGVLPVLNERAVEYAIRAGLATHSRVHDESVFERKNYFYPDLPKGYQISQLAHPICSDGWLEVEVETGRKGETYPKRVRITRIQMEEDAGKSMHEEGARGELTRVDLNRCGVPLLEIISEPDMRSPAEAGAYLRALREILRYIDVTDGDMEKGQFRCDANVSLRPHGAHELGVRTEVKNVNSFRFVEQAIAAEVERQAELLDRGEPVLQATMHFDADTGRTRVLRTKENADDYRYFPDPDLIPLVLGEGQVERVRAAMPELPEQRRARFQDEHGLSEYDARQLTASRALADFFEAAARAHGSPKSVANWVLRDVLRALKERDLDIEQSALEAEPFASLVRLTDEGRLTAQSARGLLPELIERGGDPEALVRERGLEAVTDTGLLESAVDEVLAANPEAVETFRGGDGKVLNFLMGQVMRRTQGKADAGAVRQILARKLEG